MNILIGTVIIGTIAIFLWRQLPNEEWRQTAYAATLRTLSFTLPRVFTALLGAGFFAQLLPAEHMRAWFGQETGLWGMALATTFGPITPGGAFVSFAIGAAALKAGAAPATIIAYVTSWTLFSTTRILAYELPIMGRQKLILRVLICLPVPMMIGSLSQFLL